MRKINWKTILGCMAVFVVATAVMIFLIMDGRNDVLAQNEETRSEEIKMSEVEIPLAAGTRLITEQHDDINVIPDKYNTGVVDPSKLTVVTGPGTYSGVYFGAYQTDQIKLDFKYQNKTLKNVSVVTIENVDFSNFPLTCSNESIDTAKKVIFKNCKFSSFTNGKLRGVIEYEFINCEFNRFYGSNATLSYCKLGGSYNDALNPFVDVKVENCFITDMACYLASGSAHTDGVQIYGHSSTDANNIQIRNCRFEIPAIPMTGSKAYVNACLFIGLEFSNGYNFTIDDCIMNGGGFCIYSNAKSPYVLSDVSITDIRVGTSHRWGIGFNNIVQGTTYKNIDYLDSLYVASVWKENGMAHLSVTNDTNVERKLKVYTDKGEYNYTIAACPLYDEIVPDSMTYADFPFDLDITVPDNPSWVVCFDVTDGMETQIRFKNWSKETVFISEEETKVTEENNENSTAVQEPEKLDPVIMTGICGNGVTYTLTEAGKITLSGTGATYNYNSHNRSPWYEVSDSIVTINIEEGVTQIGSQAFAGCKNLEKVVIPNGMERIGDNAFQSCSALTEVEIPRSITGIGQYAFHKAGISKISYLGSEEEWQQVQLGGKSGLDNVEIVFLTNE